MKILLVEDDARTAQLVRKALLEDGHSARHAPDGGRGLELALEGGFDVAVVDVMLPVRDGLSLIREMRASHLTTPVLVLSAKSAVDDRVRGLRAGGDDYLVKPFALSELRARLEALVRRASGVAEPTHLETGSLAMDLLRRTVLCAGTPIELQPREYALLEYFLRNSGRVVTRAMIMEHVWRYDFDPGTNLVDVRVCRLRDKLAQTSSRRFIHTIRGVGYVLEER